jgi:tetratricopeptide (TPR) repeat protein
MVLGLHGAYVQIAAMAVANAISYPIRTHGPSALELVLGALALAAALAIALAPRLGRWKPPAVARAAAVLWLFGWFPASRLVLPVRKVMIADRYLLLATLGVALAIAAGVLAISSRRARVALVAAVVVAAGLRTLDAQARWADPIALWQRALRSNPDDGDAWSVYADELASAGDQPLADHAVAEGLTHSHAPKLLLRDALFAIGRGQRAAGISRLREAADAALAWAQRSIATAPEYPSGYISLGRVALVAHRPDLALPAFAHGFAYEPTLTNWARFVLTP